MNPTTPNYLSPEFRRAYQQRWRAQPERRLCDCGQPAVKCKCGAFVCARCDAIEQRMYSRPNSQAAYVDRSRIGRRGEYARVVEPFALHLPAEALV